MLNRFNELVNPDNRDIYLKTHNKVRVDKNNYYYDEAEEFNQTAWAIHDNYVVIDVDDGKNTNRLYKIIKNEKINCHIFRSIKGAHFVFKEPTSFPVPQVTATYCAAGIKFDTRTTGKGYIVLPHNQTDRKWIKLSDRIDELPMWLFPQKKLTNIYKDTTIDPDTDKKKKVDVMPNFIEMGEGDGRNDALFRYFTNLLNNAVNMTVLEKRFSVKLLNKYVLKESLDDSELDATVLREELTESLEENVMDHGQELDPDILANKLISTNNIITKNGQMYLFKDGYYKPFSEDELQYIIHHKYDKRAKEHKRNEVVKFVKVKTDIRDKDLNPQPMMINLVNGRFNIQTLKLEQHNDMMFDTIRVPYKYNPDAQPSITLKKFLAFIANNNKDKLTLIFEMIGLSFVKKIIVETFFILLGEKGGNGKSTLLDIIENLIGIENVSNIDLSEIGTDDYAAYELYNKLANIGDDLKLSALKETGLIKTLTSGKPIQARVKFKARFKFRNYASMIYAANKIPITYDKTGGFFRRFTIIKLDKSMPVGKRDPFLIDKLTREDYEYLLRRSLKAAHDVIHRNRLTSLRESEKALERYQTENNSVLIFLEDNNLDIGDIDGMPVSDLYDSYKQYCLDYGYRVLQKGIFDGEIHKIYNVEKIQTTKGGGGNKTKWVVIEGFED